MAANMPPGAASQSANSVPLTSAEQLAEYNRYASAIIDPEVGNDAKFQALQFISENLETIIASPHYVDFLEHSMPIFLRVLTDTDPQFISEHPAQQLRKVILEIFHRLPANDTLRAHIRSILQLMFKLLEVDNEENVLICLRIIIELHKQFRPIYSTEVRRLLFCLITRVSCDRKSLLEPIHLSTVCICQWMRL